MQQDQARLKHLLSKAGAKHNAISRFDLNTSSPVPVENQAVSYIASVGVGSPATYYDVIVDTGSSNTWVGANKAFVPTSTSVNTTQPISVGYGSGGFNGSEFYDTVTLSDSLVIKNQSIGVASIWGGFEDSVNGILGLGPVGLTNGTLVGVYEEIPTVTDNLKSQGTITGQSVSVSFQPTTTNTSINGELTFGGTSSDKFTGNMTYTPLTDSFPASEYWGINQTVSYGTTEIMASDAGIVDTGTTLVYLPSDAFASYINSTGGVLDDATGLYSITPAQYAALDTLNFNIGGTTFGLTPNAQIWPRSLNSFLGGSTDAIYLIVGNMGVPSGSGFDFINGQVFLERFYTVFDTTNQRFGIATTNYTTSTTN